MNSVDEIIREMVGGGAIRAGILPAVRLAPDVRAVLELCESGPEARFALGFKSLPGFRVRPPDRFEAHGISLTLQEKIGPYRADFVVRVDGAPAPVVVEIDGRAWHYSTEAQWRSDRVRQREIEARGFRAVRCPASQAGEFGKRLWWAFSRDTSESGQIGVG